MEPHCTNIIHCGSAVLSLVPSVLSDVATWVVGIVSTLGGWLW